MIHLITVKIQNKNYVKMQILKKKHILQTKKMKRRKEKLKNRMNLSKNNAFT